MLLQLLGLALLTFGAPDGTFPDGETPGVFPASPFDQVIEVDITGDVEAIAGYGGGDWIDFEVEFDGALRIWTEGELDLVLQVDDEETNRIALDEDKGGGTTPFVWLEVSAGEVFYVGVAARQAGVEGSARLHLVASPETEGTRAAATALRTAMGGRKRRSAIDEERAALGAIEGAMWSDAIEDALWDAGFALQQAGDFQGAQRCWEPVRAHRERVMPPTHDDLLVTRENLAAAMTLNGEHAGAAALFRSALAVRRRIQPAEHGSVLTTQLNLSAALIDLGDLQGARALQERVIAVRERTLPADHVDLLLAYGNLAATLNAMGDHEAALALEERVLEGFERTLPEGHRDLHIARQNHALTVGNLGDPERARRMLEAEVERLAASVSEEHPGLLSARTNLATTLHELGEHDAARELEEAVLAARERTLPEDHPELLLSRGNLAGTLVGMREFEAARALLEEVVAARERTLPEDHPEVLQARGNLAEALTWLGDREGELAMLPKLLRSLRLRAERAATLAPRETRELLVADAVRIDQVLYLCEVAGDDARREVLELVETRRAVAAEGLGAEHALGRDPAVVALRTRVARAREDVNAAVMRRSRGRIFERQLASATTERDAAQRELRAALSERGVRAPRVELAELAASLPEATAAVGFLRYERSEEESAGRFVPRGPHLLAHVVRADGSFTRVELGAVETLERAVREWRTGLGAPLGEQSVAVADAGGARGQRGVPLNSAEDSEAERGAGERLRATLLDPILAALGDETRALFVCPDDLVFLLPLDALPLDALPLGDGRVGDRLALRVLSSFGELVAPPPPAPEEPGLLVLGGAHYGTSAPDAAPAERFEALPGSGREAEELAALFRDALGVEPELLTGDGATKSALADELGGRRFVHLATHGWFAPESVRSRLDEGAAPRRRRSAAQRVTGLAPLTLCGLALAGGNLGIDALGRRSGILTAEELAFLPLEDCALAVLSACETNVGIRRAGQGIQSLQTALHAAGARAAITSLWRVDDARTRELMQGFYTHLWVDGLPVAEALWRAKAAQRAAGTATRDWAGWVLSGTLD